MTGVMLDGVVLVPMGCAVRLARKGDVLRRACGSGVCLVWAGLVPSLLVATSDSCHEFAQADLLSEVALEPVHKPFN